MLRGGGGGGGGSRYEIVEIGKAEKKGEYLKCYFPKVIWKLFHGKMSNGENTSKMLINYIWLYLPQHRTTKNKI